VTPQAPRGSDPSEESAWDTAVSSEARRHFRPDIEGLRAVAILGVLAFHARIPGMRGGFVGVDVFFVISGFLITGLLLRELSATNRIDLAGFYARRGRRLLPAALAGIAVTVALSLIVLSPLRSPEVARDGAWAALYASNYRYALVATDYFAANRGPSPLLHYWSLGVEEQFYLFWPMLVLIGVRVLSGRWLWTGIALVGLASFAFSLWLTALDPTWAFYSLPTRAWQLAVGALLAVLIATRPPRIGATIATSLGVLGLAMIGVSIVIFNGSTPFPGWAALLPVLGAAFVIAGGHDHAGLPASLLASPFPRWIGRISYSLYIWHWPILILVPLLIGTNILPVRIALALLAIGVAALSTRFIETPFRCGRGLRLASGRTLVLAGGASAALAVVAIGIASALESSPVAAPLPTLPPPGPTAPPPFRGVVSGPLPTNLQPTLLAGSTDGSQLGGRACMPMLLEIDLRDCVFGDVSSPTTVVLFGDSHAGMWFPAIRLIAEEKGWRLVPFVKPACSPADVTVWRGSLLRPLTECNVWRERALERMEQLHPAIVLVATSRHYDVADSSGQKHPMNLPDWRDGMVRTLLRLRGMSDRVILIGESPTNRGDPVECLAVHERIQDCQAPRHQVVNARYQAIERSAAREAGIQLIPTIPWLCTDDVCPLVLDHYLVYRNTSHLTGTMSAALAPYLRWAIDHPPR
jgi:peptidoglycan/LPS O-acetylase OafA/YrhL